MDTRFAPLTCHKCVLRIISSARGLRHSHSDHESWSAHVPLHVISPELHFSCVRVGLSLALHNGGIATYSRAAVPAATASTNASISALMAGPSLRPSRSRVGRPANPHCAPRRAPMMQPECTFSPPRLALRSTPFSNCESAAHASPRAEGTDCGRYQETTASNRPLAISRAACLSAGEFELAHAESVACLSGSPLTTARSRPAQTLA